MISKCEVFLHLVLGDTTIICVCAPLCMCVCTLAVFFVYLCVHVIMFLSESDVSRNTEAI